MQTVPEIKIKAVLGDTFNLKIGDTLKAKIVPGTRNTRNKEAIDVTGGEKGYTNKEFAGRWQKMSICEQLANIGSEVERALNWRVKGSLATSQRAFERGLELVDLTIESVSNPAHLKELTLMRSALVDYFVGKNEFGSTDASWRKYFMHFAYAVRKNC